MGVNEVADISRAKMRFRTCALVYYLKCAEKKYGASTYDRFIIENMFKTITAQSS